MAAPGGNESHSGRFALDRADWRKIGTGLLVALVGSFATFLADLTTTIDFGLWAPFVSMVLGVLVNVLRKWLADNAPAPTDQEPAVATPPPARSGLAGETIVLLLAAATLGLIGAAIARPRTTRPMESIPVDEADREHVTGAFVLERQLFARVCLEAARRARSGEVASEEAENAWCEPRWAAARAAAFGQLAASRDRHLAGGWTPESSAAGLEAWAVVADPTLAREASRP